MLWYKGWCETRARVAIAVAAVGAVCALVLVAGGDARHAGATTHAARVWAAVYDDSVKTMFILLVILLGGGSLRQEHAHGTLGFTLALPVPRSRLVAVRAAVGIAQVWLLALLVGILVPVIAGIAGDGYPVTQSLSFSLRWGVCGALVFCVSLLASTLLASAYLAWLAAFLAVIGYEAIVNLTALRGHPLLDLYGLMSGSGEAYFSARDGLLVGPLPWAALGTVTLAGACLLALAGLRARWVEL